MQVLELYGAQALAINGSMSYDQRARIVERFKQDAACRILIFTKVGTVGLNLTVADTIILLVRFTGHALAVYWRTLTPVCRINSGRMLMRIKR